MALLFQSRPTIWKPLSELSPGDWDRWYVTRFKSYMRKGVLVLLWEANSDPNIRGFWGWGITADDLRRDKRGDDRIKVEYIEAWRCRDDELHAPVTAEEVFSLDVWEGHLLNTMPRGTNFLVDHLQLKRLVNVIESKTTESQLPMAAKFDQLDELLSLDQFEGRTITW